MNMNGKKSPDMLSLEDCFAQLKNKQDIQGNITRMQRIINRNFDVNFQITIVENKTNKFFGMSIYPSEGYVDKIVEAILADKPNTQTVVELWHENKDWYLEIDSIMLHDTQLNANPSELVAVLLHEIGHVIYSNSIPERITKVIRYQKMHMSSSVKNLLQWDKARKLFGLGIVEASSTKNFHFVNMDAERVSDKFVVKMGYGQSLDTFIGKLIASQGNSLVNRTEDDVEREVSSVVSWVVDNVTELQFRKSKLRVSLQAEVLQNPSPYIKRIVGNLRAIFFGNDNTDQMAVIVAEQNISVYAQNIVTEGLLDIFDKYGKLTKVTQSDVDLLVVEAGRIDNEDDKIYVLDLIYDKLDIVNAGLELIDQNKKDKVPVSKETLNNYKNQLEKLRKSVLETQIKPKSYGVFVKYPKGYEG